MDISITVESTCAPGRSGDPAYWPSGLYYSPSTRALIVCPHDGADRLWIGQSRIEKAQPVIAIADWRSLKCGEKLVIELRP